MNKVEYNLDDQGVVTFRDLVIEIFAIGRYLLLRWYVIVAFVLLAAGGMYWYAASQTADYVAVLTFTVRGSDERSVGGGGGSVLAQLGLGETQSSAGLNLARLEAIAKSRSIVRDVLFSEAVILGDTDFVANHLIDVYDYRTTVWEDNEKLATFPGFTEAPNSEEDILGNTIIGSLTRLLTAGKDPTIAFLFDPITTIHSITVSSPNDHLSAQMVEIVYNVLNMFYVNNAVQKQREIVERLEVRADSTSRLVLQNEATLATRQDRGRDIVSQRSEVGRNQIQRRLQINTTIYLEIIQNLEIARYTLSNITPSFQIIDRPVYPLPTRVVSKTLFVTIGFFVGLFISVTLLILWRAIRRAVATSKI